MSVYTVMLIVTMYRERPSCMTIIIIMVHVFTNALYTVMSMHTQTVMTRGSLIICVCPKFHRGSLRQSLPTEHCWSKWGYVRVPLHSGLTTMGPFLRVLPGWILSDSQNWPESFQWLPWAYFPSSEPFREQLIKSLQVLTSRMDEVYFLYCVFLELIWF